MVERASLHNPFKVPRAGLTEYSVIFDPSCEAMIFDESGVALEGESFSQPTCGPHRQPFSGITGAFDYNRRVEYIIPKREVEMGTCVRYLEISANGVFGIDGDPPRVSLIVHPP